MTRHKHVLGLVIRRDKAIISYYESFVARWHSQDISLLYASNCRMSYNFLLNMSNRSHSVIIVKFYANLKEPQQKGLYEKEKRGHKVKPCAVSHNISV